MLDQLLPFLIPIGLLVTVVLFFILQTQHTQPLPYQPRIPFLTPAEQRLYKALQSNLPPNTAIAPQVALSTLLTIPPATTNYFAHRNRISQKYIDFLLFDTNTFKPLLVIELDDTTHHQQHRKSRDHLLNTILSNANIPIIHIKPQPQYDLTNIHQTLQHNKNLSA